MIHALLWIRHKANICKSSKGHLITVIMFLVNQDIAVLNVNRLNLQKVLLMELRDVEYKFVLTTILRFPVHRNAPQELIIMVKYGVAQVIMNLIIILERHFIP